MTLSRWKPRTGGSSGSRSWVALRLVSIPRLVASPASAWLPSTAAAAPVAAAAAADSSPGPGAAAAASPPARRGAGENQTGFVDWTREQERDRNRETETETEKQRQRSRDRETERERPIHGTRKAWSVQLGKTRHLGNSRQHRFPVGDRVAYLVRSWCQQHRPGSQLWTRLGRLLLRWQRRSKSGQIVVKRRSNRGQTVVKQRSNGGPDRQLASLTAQCRQVYCLVEMAPSAPSWRPPHQRG